MNESKETERRGSSQSPKDQNQSPINLYEIMKKIKDKDSDLGEIEEIETGEMKFKRLGSTTSPPGVVKKCSDNSSSISASESSSRMNKESCLSESDPTTRSNHNLFDPRKLL